LVRQLLAAQSGECADAIDLTLVIDPNLLLLKKKLWVIGSWLHDPFMRQYIQHGEVSKVFRYEYSEVLHHLFGSIVTQLLS